MVMARQLEELEEERKELQTKLKSQGKKVDHSERAKRVEEVPLIGKYLAERQVQDKLLWEQQEKERMAQMMEERNVAMLHRDRLIRMRDEKNKFIDNLKAARRNVFKGNLDEFEAMYEKVRSPQAIKRPMDQRYS